VSGNEKDRSVENIFFFNHFPMTECIFIFTHCNINAIIALIVINNIRKELIMIAVHYGNQIVANQSTISITINNIDSNHYKIYWFYLLESYNYFFYQEQR